MTTSPEFIQTPDNIWKPNTFLSSTTVVFVRQLVQLIKLCPCIFLANIKLNKSCVLNVGFFVDADEVLLELMSQDVNEHGLSIWRCLVCKEVFKKRQHIKHHIESKHNPGLAFRCHFCPTVCRTRAALTMHRKRNHPPPTIKAEDNSTIIIPQQSSTFDITPFVSTEWSHQKFHGQARFSALGLFFVWFQV